MDQTFVNEVLPVVVRYARLRRLDDERASIAQVLAWWHWSHRTQDFPPSVWAIMGVRHAIAGRDLPGVQSSRFRDVYDYLCKWDGADMGRAMDRRPGPEEVVQWREELANLIPRLNDQQRELLALVREDGNNGTLALAAHFGKTPSRISQIRREIMNKANE